MKNYSKNLALTLLLVISTTSFFAQNAKKDFDYSNRFSLLFGQIQPTVLSGFNVEVNYFTKKMAFDYSHGVSLDAPAAGDVKEQNLVWHLPYSTGFNIGYRLTNSFDIRFEPKLHSWEAYYKDEVQNDQTRIKDFTTVTLGIGIYYRYFPFKNSDNKFLQGITTSSSVRWWQNTSTSTENQMLLCKENCKLEFLFNTLQLKKLLFRKSNQLICGFFLKNVFIDLRERFEFHNRFIFAS